MIDQIPKNQKTYRIKYGQEVQNEKLIINVPKLGAKDVH